MVDRRGNSINDIRLHDDLDYDKARTNHPRECQNTNGIS
jgi:hypothetical protein